MESGRIGASLEKYHCPAKLVQNGARMADGTHTAPPPRILSHSLTVYDVYMLRKVGSGHGASKGAENLIGHVRVGPVVGTTFGSPPKMMGSW